jgi:hypothetical protein
MRARRQTSMLSRGEPFKRIQAGSESFSQPELFAGFPRYRARRIPLSIRVRCMVGFGRYPVGFARGSCTGVRRIGADVRSADAVTSINGATRAADIGPLGDMPILLSHHGRGQHGCGDQVTAPRAQKIGRHRCGAGSGRHLRQYRAVAGPGQ